MPGSFFDTNVLVYATTGTGDKASRGEQLVRAGGVISVQVLNELASVLRRKSRMEWAEVVSAIRGARAFLIVRPLTAAVHDAGMALAGRYGFSVYDSMIVAAAVEAGCRTLWSEDMQDGMVVEGVRIVNPFRVG